MPAKIYRIKLAPDERSSLESLSKKGKISAIKVLRCRALLLADESEFGPGLSDHKIADAVGLSTRALQRLRQRCCEVGPLGALERKPRDTPPVEKKITGEVEAGLVRIACSKTPEGFPRWTMQMIADKAVEIGLIESISDESVRLVLKKTN